MCKKLLLGIIFSVFLLTSVSFTQIKKMQDKDSLKKEEDSLRTQMLDEGTEELLTVDSLRAADSVKLSLLQAEIEKLKSTDNLSKQRLLQQIDSVRKQDSLRKEELRQKIQLRKDETPGFPVILGYDTLFVVYTRIGSFTIAQRAESISNKILQIAERHDYDSSKLTLRISDRPEIIYDNIIIITITEEDAIWNESTSELLAEKYKTIINNAVFKHKEDTSLTSWLIRLGKALLIIIALAGLLKGLSKLFILINKKIFSLKGTVLKGLKIKSYELWDADKQVKAVLFLAKLFKWFLVLLLIYFALLMLFGVFPGTRYIADTLLDYIIKPFMVILTGFIDFIPNLFAILVIVIITKYLVKFVLFLAGEIEKGKLTISGFYPDWAKPTANIVRFVLYALMFVAIFPYLPGSDSPIFQGVSVFIGLLISLGSTSAVANAVAGIVITYMRPFKVGDRVKIGDVLGDVIEKSILVTRVRTTKNEDISIPNASILTGHTINYSSSSDTLGLILYTTVTIGYDVPWQKVQELLINAALDTEGIDKTKKPFVLQTSLDDFYVSYQLNAYTNLPNQMAQLYSRLHQQIQDKFNEAGVEIMSPHYGAIRDGSTVTLPPDYLPKDYKAPEINLKINKDK
ncbi:MAG: mechanosensitive ion channel family protein [Ignavibacteria bacterium]|nr:mechanosensitive ion channel family protein [Ignavibacteria bacterium]